MDKSCILPFPQKCDLGIVKNYRGIILTSIAAKVYNALLLNRIESEIEKILGKNQYVFWRNQSTTSQILTMHQIIKGVCAKNLVWVTYFLILFFLWYYCKINYKIKLSAYANFDITEVKTLLFDSKPKILILLEEKYLKITTSTNLAKISHINLN